jgi:hypothetical protein
MTRNDGGDGDDEHVDNDDKWARKKLFLEGEFADINASLRPRQFLINF